MGLWELWCSFAIDVSGEQIGLWNYKIGFEDYSHVTCLENVLLLDWGER